MLTYSAIILFKETEEERKLAELQYMIAKKFSGKSAIYLPPHITLMKWKSQKPISDSLQLSIHSIQITCDVFLEIIEISPNRKSIWYRVVNSSKVDSVSKQIYQILLSEGESKDNVILSHDFHVTLAYKDYSEKEIHKIFQFLKKSRLNNFRLFADKIALSTVTKDGKWSIMYSS